MIQLTEREYERIMTVLRDIRRESKHPRTHRIENLTQRISLILVKSKMKGGAVK